MKMSSMAVLPDEVLKGSSNAIFTEFKIIVSKMNPSKIGCSTIA